MSTVDNPYHVGNSLPSVTRVEYPEGYFRPIAQFDLMRMIRSPFVSPNWAMNWVWMFVCDILSLFMVGNIISVGYAMYVGEARTGGRDQVWPDFEFEKVTDYLVRGVWPFLWQMIGALIVAMVVGIPAVATIAVGSALMNGQEPSLPSILVWGVGGAATILFGFVMMVAMLGVSLHSGLANDFIRGADVNWLTSFVSRMWLQVIYISLVVSVAAIGMTIAGILALCLGLLIVGPLFRLYAGDLIAQVHDIFITRGGQPAFEIAIIPADDVIDAQVLS